MVSDHPTIDKVFLCLAFIISLQNVTGQRTRHLVAGTLHPLVRHYSLFTADDNYNRGAIRICDRIISNGNIHATDAGALK